MMPLACIFTYLGLFTGVILHGLVNDAWKNT